MAIDEISGIMDHSEACTLQIEMERNPQLPLHPELWDYALALLCENSPLSLLRSCCSDWAEKRWPGEVGTNSARYRLTTHDASSLYQSISKEHGILQCSAAEENLDLWFRKEKPHPPSSLLPNSCLHYQAHKKPETDRFEIVLVTLDMHKAAWKYGHKKQVLMNLTFRFCSAWALLAILMAIDSSGSGVPIALIIFTARESAQAIHADYDTAVLDRLLAHYKKGMGTDEHGEEFDIQVAGTDNDPCEQGALSKNWATVFLILCMFHVWQAWHNGLNHYLRSIPKGDTWQSVQK
ncbi:unnamed protein product [Cyclocybe aegerita]|uniref:Uncharacterized protein n=1 Tax=Cyclocybe aegerita TaxID=1973307 RepID=A0A8S0W953_CYCAE|nr:unnamed protein product [Cyclocybe aegerita]